MNDYEAIVIGVSAGGMQALATMIPALPATFAYPIVVVQHVSEDSDGYLSIYLNNLSALRVEEAEDKKDIVSGVVYIAPAGYHLMIEENRTFSLSVDAPVHYARPSIDVLFETAADVYRSRLIGVILTGANADGSQGLRRIKAYGGLTIVQDPATAESSCMPQMAINTVSVDHILPLNGIASFLAHLTEDALL